MSSAHSPTFPRFQLGKQLRELREKARLTTEDVGLQLDCSPSTISRMEGGKVGIRRSTLERLLEIYEVTDQEQIDTLVVLARQGKTRGWFARYGDLPASYSRYIGLESSAVEMRDYEALVVPGMLQTEEYTRALLAASASTAESDETGEAHVKARRERQNLLTREEQPLQLIAVLDESVIRRSIGGVDVMRSQLKHLADMGRARNVTVQILPFSGGAYAGMAGSFAILKFQDAPSVVYAEAMTGDIYPAADDVQRYADVFENLRAAALSPLESIKMIEDSAN
ncbi:helix-turn-helix domain-containing protein [Dactylosporangium sp. NPDC051541]|uniref:helix-turn-helix domain-containing protein n=1 Tax=Dactylosporangium sp. NPDC051541 TaxID=3363977 RepID=UPI0037A31920